MLTLIGKQCVIGFNYLFCKIPASSELAQIIGGKNYRKLCAHARGQAWKNKAMVPASFTTDDKVVVYLYTHQTLKDYHYKSINAVLRGLPHIKEAELLKIAAMLESALQKLPAHPAECHRLTYLDTRSLAAHGAGSCPAYPAFTSSGLQKWKAKSGQVRIVIHGKTGRYIAKFSRFPDEQEVLYLPNTNFLVLFNDLKWDDSLKKYIVVIVLEEV